MQFGRWMRRDACDQSRQKQNRHLLCSFQDATEEIAVNNIIYIVGLVVVVIAVLSFFGLR